MFCKAKDSDEGNNSRIAYELLNSKDGGEFSIDRQTGWIKAKASYAGKHGKEFVVDVIAKDRFGEAPCFNDTAEVKVILIKLKKIATLGPMTYSFHGLIVLICVQ